MYFVYPGSSRAGGYCLDADGKVTLLEDDIPCTMRNTEANGLQAGLESGTESCTFEMEMAR